MVATPLLHGLDDVTESELNLSHLSWWLKDVDGRLGPSPLTGDGTEVLELQNRIQVLTHCWKPEPELFFFFFIRVAET